MSFKIKPIVKAYEDFLPNAVYKVNYEFYSKGKDKKVFIKTYLPENNERQKISKAKQSSKDMSFQIKDENGNQRAVWRDEKESQFQTVNYSFIYKGKSCKVHYR